MGASQQFTKDEVLARSRYHGGDLWLIYKDVVYDITNFVDKHPGGDVIAEEAGRDASATFDGVGHSPEERAALEEYRIGEIVEEEREYDAEGRKKRRPEEARPKRGGLGSCCLLA